MTNNFFVPKIDLTFHQGTEGYIIHVTDNGIGIKQEERAKMYAPFYTTKDSSKSGAGLGMYVVKRIIEDDHKGQIWFESEPFKYCTFYIKIPLSH